MGASMCVLKPSKLGIVNSLCCGIGAAAGYNLIWIVRHWTTVERAGASLYRLLAAWCRGMGGP